MDLQNLTTEQIRQMQAILAAAIPNLAQQQPTPRAPSSSPTKRVGSSSSTTSNIPTRRAESGSAHPATTKQRVDEFTNSRYPGLFSKQREGEQPHHRRAGDARLSVHNSPAPRVPRLPTEPPRPPVTAVPPADHHHQEDSYEQRMMNRKSLLDYMKRNPHAAEGTSSSPSTSSFRSSQPLGSGSSGRSSSSLLQNEPPPTAAPRYIDGGGFPSQRHPPAPHIVPRVVAPPLPARTTPPRPAPATPPVPLSQVPDQELESRIARTAEMRNKILESMKKVMNKMADPPPEMVHRYMTKLADVQRLQDELREERERRSALPVPPPVVVRPPSEPRLAPSSSPRKLPPQLNRDNAAASSSGDLPHMRPSSSTTNSSFHRQLLEQRRSSSPDDERRLPSNRRSRTRHSSGRSSEGSDRYNDTRQRKKLKKASSKPSPSSRSHRISPDDDPDRYEFTQEARMRRKEARRQKVAGMREKDRLRSRDDDPSSSTGPPPARRPRRNDDSPPSPGSRRRRGRDDDGFRPLSRSSSREREDGERSDTDHEEDDATPVSLPRDEDYRKLEMLFGVRRRRNRVMEVRKFSFRNMHEDEKKGFFKFVNFIRPEILERINVHSPVHLQNAMLFRDQAVEVHDLWLVYVEKEIRTYPKYSTAAVLSVMCEMIENRDSTIVYNTPLERHTGRQVDVLDHISRTGECWKETSYPAFKAFVKTVFDVVETRFRNQNRYREFPSSKILDTTFPDLVHIMQEIELLWPQFADDITRAINIWVWRDKWRGNPDVVNFSGQYYDFPSRLLKDRSKETRRRRIYDWLTDTYKDRPKYESDEVNARILATMTRFMGSTNTKQIVSTVVNWWCNGFYQLNYASPKSYLPDIVIVGGDDDDEYASEEEEEYRSMMERAAGPSGKRPDVVSLLNDNEVKLTVKVKGLSEKHPISALMEICAKKKWGAPRFELTSDLNQKFVFKVIVNTVDYFATKTCSNKKLAKAHVALIALDSLGLITS